MDGYGGRVLCWHHVFNQHIHCIDSLSCAHIVRSRSAWPNTAACLGVPGRCCVEVTSHRETQRCSCKIISNAPLHKKWRRVGGFLHRRGVLTVLASHWSHVRSSNWEATVDIFPEIMVSTWLFQVRLGCCLFQKLELHKQDGDMLCSFSVFSNGGNYFHPLKSRMAMWVRKCNECLNPPSG